MRATPEGATRFIEPAPGVLSKAKSKQHNIVFGRRGSGKSSLLRKIAADLTVDRRPIAFVDMETFKGHTYPDVLISVLIKALREFEEWLNSAAINPAAKTSFWAKLFGTKPNRAPFNKKKTSELSQRLKAIIEDLDDQLKRPETAESEIREKIRSSKGADGSLTSGVDTGAINVKNEIKLSASIERDHELISRYISHKVEYLHQNIIRFQKFFQELSTLSDGSAFLILDDL